MPVGVHLCTLDGVAHTPIDVIGNFLEKVSAKSHSNIYPNTSVVIPKVSNFNKMSMLKYKIIKPFANFLSKVVHSLLILFASITKELC